MSIDANTPWKIDVGHTIIDANNDTVCITKWLHDSDHIVHCVNNYDDLVLFVRKVQQIGLVHALKHDDVDLLTMANQLLAAVDGQENE